MSLITTSKCCQNHDSTAVNGGILPGVGINWCSGGCSRRAGGSAASNNDIPPASSTLTVRARMATQLSCSAATTFQYSANERLSAELFLLPSKMFRFLLLLASSFCFILFLLFIMLLAVRIQMQSGLFLVYIFSNSQWLCY